MSLSLQLEHGAWQVLVHPQIGASLGYLRHDGAALLREMSAGAVDARNVRLSACYPLVPCSNRIGRGVFRFEGVEYHLQKNFDDSTNTIHGVGWKSEWAVARHDRAAVVLTLRHRPQSEAATLWPFAFDAEQKVSLSEDGLTLALNVVNRSDRNMPAGLGWHPYFVRTPRTTLAFEAKGAWMNGADHLPAERSSTAQWDYSRPRVVVEHSLDHLFFGWSGRATLRDESLGKQITLEADSLFQHLVVYAPPERPFVAVEPVSNMTDAVNRMHEADHGLRVLAPGEHLSGAIRIGVTTL